MNKTAPYLTSLLFILACLAGCEKQKESGGYVATDSLHAHQSVSSSSKNLPSSNELSLWMAFQPLDSKDAQIVISRAGVVGPSGELPLEMSSDRLARYAITPKSGAINVHPGEIYRLSAWVKADDSSADINKSRGVLLRGTLFTPTGDYAEGHFYVGKEGVILGTPEKYLKNYQPADWVKLVGVVKIPPSVTKMKLFIFAWWMQGRVYVDNAILERADGAPLSEVISDK